MVNNVVLMGRLVANPEKRQTGSGKSVANFTIAVDKFKREDGADFINCVAWDKTADFICNFFQKGSMVAVVGSIQTRKYEDKEGNNRTATEVNVREASFCGGKNENGSPENAKPKAEPKAEFEEIEDDEDLPF